MSLKVRTLLVLAAGIAMGLSLSLSRGVLADKEAAASSGTLPWEDAALLAEVLERVRQDYVESVDDHKLMESAIRGMVSALDPHSQFLDPEEYDEIRISTTGAYSGVGIEVTMQDGAVRVVAPIDGTPAAHAGIEAGDTIVSIDDVPVDTQVRFRINDQNWCDENPTGAVTRNVFVNGTGLVQNATTPGQGDEPGYALAVSASGRITQ